MYQKTNWQSGDTITAAKLNNIENGIAGGGVLESGMNPETMALDKTWKEIHDASYAILTHSSDEYTKIIMMLLGVAGSAQDGYTCSFVSLSDITVTYAYHADTPDDYPVMRQ